MKRIEITVSRTGETSIEAFGFEGKECLKAAESFEEALGKVKERKMKAEAARQTTRPTVKAR